MQSTYAMDDPYSVALNVKDNPLQKYKDQIGGGDKLNEEAREIKTNDVTPSLTPDNQGSREYHDLSLKPGQFRAGPGEKRKLLKFDVKAFFEENPSIKEFGKQSDLTFRISGDAQIMREILRAHGLQEQPLKSCFSNLSWVGNSVPELFIDQMLEYQSINHFVGSTHLTRKDKLYKNVTKMRRKTGPGHFEFLPISFVLPKEWKRFKRFCKKHAFLWIVKPVGLSRGRGVYLVNEPKSIINKEDDLLVSKYINNPLLIEGYKLDLRIYVLVTSFDPLVIYIYKEGLTRFATVKYRKGFENIAALRMHLTNFSINVCSGHFIRNEDPTIEDFGSKWTLSALLRYFDAKGLDTTTLMTSIESLIVETLLSVEKPMASGSRIYQRKPSNCYELFGFDIMLDDHLKAWLLEVNLSPSLVCSTPLDIKVKSNMLVDLLNVVGVECYEKQKPQEGKTFRRAISQYIHITVGYYCICLIRDRIRGMFHTRKKRYRKIMKTYKLPADAIDECYQRQEVKRSQLMSHLKPRDVKMITRIKNEETRSGGWVRIFPTADSWEKYRKLMVYKTPRNIILHRHLYPDLTLSGNTKRNIATKAKSDLSERVKLYQSGVQICPPPSFQTRTRDNIPPEENLILSGHIKSQLLNQINDGRSLSEVQARTAFRKYLTNLKQAVKKFERTDGEAVHPPVSSLRNLLFKFLGQSSDLIIEEKNPRQDYTLDDCLNNFLYHYHKETRNLSKQPLRRNVNVSQAGEGEDKKIHRHYVSSGLFEEYIHSADPWDLEELLITHLNVHQDSKIFLRSRVWNCDPSTRYEVPMYKNVNIEQPQPGKIWTTV